MTLKVKAMRNKILAEMIDDPGEEQLQQVVLFFLRKMALKMQLDLVGSKCTVSETILTG